MAPLDAQPTPGAPPAGAAPLDPALAALIERWRGPLVGLARAWRVPRPIELAQDVFAELWLSRARFEGDWADDTVLGPWLRGIAWNLVAAQKRRDAKGPRPIDDVDPPVTEESETGGIEARAERDERAALLRAAVDALPRDQRAVVVMIALEQTPPSRVAALLDISVRAVEGRLYRARKELARSLESLETEVTS